MDLDEELNRETAFWDWVEDEYDIFKEGIHI